jgi:hypothetical protein
MTRHGRATLWGGHCLTVLERLSMRRLALRSLSPPVPYASEEASSELGSEHTVLTRFNRHRS